MTKYNNTAIVIGNTKEALLYFDHIIPVNLGVEWIKSQPESVSLPPRLGEQILPPRLRKDPQFLESLVAVNEATTNILLKAVIAKFGLPPKIEGLSDSEYESIEEIGANAFYGLLDDFHLKELPVDCSINVVSEEGEDQSDISVTLLSLHLVDAESCPWEQILEFRRDIEARDKLRRLRLFAYDNYRNKSKGYIEDDILRRMADYEEAVKLWGFETRHSALNMLLTSKMLAGALTGSFLSSLFGAPATVIIAAGTAVAIELGRITLEVGKRRFEFRKLMAENPVSYISRAKAELEHKA